VGRTGHLIVCDMFGHPRGPNSIRERRVLRVLLDTINGRPIDVPTIS